MREILFRGAQKVDGAKSLIWYEGSLVIEKDSYTGEKEYYIQNENGSYLVIPETIGQYIGLPDKKDKRIFEGDIVKMRSYGGGYHNTTVYFMNGKFAVNGSNYGFKDICSNSVEVIGNIYDNPELLEDKR